MTGLFVFLGFGILLWAVFIFIMFRSSFVFRVRIRANNFDYEDNMHRIGTDETYSWETRTDTYGSLPSYDTMLWQFWKWKY